MPQQADILPFPGKQGFITCNGYTERQMPLLNVPLLSSLFTMSFIANYSIILIYGTEHPFGQLGSAVLTVSPSSPSWTLNPLSGRAE